MDSNISFKDFMAVAPIQGYDEDPDGMLAYQQYKRKRNLTEEEELLSESITLAQRMKRRLIFKRNSSRIRLGRERASHRRAGANVLQRRALNAAKVLMTRKLLGGRTKDEVGATEKGRIEDLLKKRKKVLIRIAKKLLPQIRKRDSEKMLSKNTNESQPHRPGGAPIPR